MSDCVAMTVNTEFHNPRIRNAKNGLVEAGDTFETDLAHAQDLERLGHAVPLAGPVLGIAPAPLEPHHQVSESALRADRARRRAAEPA
ncbi:hypothetical protein ACN9MF_04095 [Methylobacterium fujisawaense]|uniref:hypothetical protein n=1 Tax=Methylobacterium fujisawaense TaxID=107400 RepID=UPI00313B3A63